MPLTSPHFSDKIEDWMRIVAAGGEALFTDKDALDLGPSYGIDTYMFAPKCRSYTVVETAPDVLEHLTKLQTVINFNVVVHNLQKTLPFPDASFDTVLDLGTIDNVLGGIRVYQECIRVLRPGGVFVCSFANQDFLGDRFSPALDEERFTYSELAAALVDAGAKDVVGARVAQARAGLIARK